MLLRSIAALSLILAAALYVFASIPLWMAVLAFAGAWLALFLLAFGFLCLICALVDMDKPQETDSKFYRAVMYIYIEALISLVRVRLHTQGLEKTPRDGRFLLVCNHLFVADPGIVLHCFRKSQLTFITKQENQRLFIIGKFMHKIRCQPIDRDNDRQALKAILKCVQILKNDEASVAVFPEGYTSRDGKLHHFRSGVFKIAQKTKVPIVVCTIRNTRQIFKNLAKLRRTDVEFHLVDVIQPQDYQGLTTVELGNRIYEMMIGDLGEEFRQTDGEHTP